MRKYSEIEYVTRVLRICNTPKKKTEIARKVGFSHNRMKPLTDSMIQRALIREVIMPPRSNRTKPKDVSRYKGFVITEHGLDMLKAYDYVFRLYDENLNRIYIFKSAPQNFEDSDEYGFKKMFKEVINAYYCPKCRIPMNWYDETHTVIVCEKCKFKKVLKGDGHEVVREAQ